MMRETRAPQKGCGTSRVVCRHLRAAGWARVAALASMAAILGWAVPDACAQTFNPKNPMNPLSSGTASSFSNSELVGPSRNIDTSQPLYLQGDELIYDTSGDKVIARGNVEIYYNNYILTADEVIYDQAANTLTAVGNVVVKEPNGNILRTDRYTMTDDFRDGFVQSLSIVASDDSRIVAEGATRRGGNITEFTNARFTPCKTTDNMPPLWCISAARVVHDQQAATITYQDAQFEIFGTPVLYLPYFQHADPSVKRKSGFLMPEFGTSDAFGFSTTIPYYFALAPNYDFTFYPKYMSRQGVLWQGDWRHRLANGQYNIKIAGIDQDANDLPSSITNPEDFDGWRGSLETKGLFSLSSWWKAGWDVTIESDDAFRRFYKLDNILLTDRVNKVFLTGQSDRNYFGMNLYHLGGLLLDDNSQTESLIHPIIDYNYIFDDPVLGGELRWDTNVLSMSRDQGPTSFAPDIPDGNTETMNRLVTEVSWRRRMTDTLGITYTPFAHLRGDVYQIGDYVDPEDPQGPLQNDTLARGLALGGVTVAYPWVANSSVGSHVIEPIGQIIARQSSIDQNNLPDEDAKSLVFNDVNLFDWNKFSGYDRIETGTRANVGLQYTFQANTGGYARVLLGQSFQLAGDNAYANPGVDANGDPVFSPFSGLESSRSDYVLGAYIAPTNAFRLISQSRFDEAELDLRRQDAAVVAEVGPFSASVIYAYTASDPEAGIDDEQQDLYSYVGFKVTNHWSVGGAIRYDIDDQIMAQNMVRVRYADDCFVLTASYTDNNYQNPEIADGQTFMVRFELKHLGEFGYATDSLDYVFGEQQSGG